MSKISIITPLHNKGPYIAETVKSVLSQTLTDWEWLVVENHSTDGGPKQVGDVNDKRVRLVNAPPAVRGPGAARNIGIAEATGDYILFLDADDLIAPNHLETLLLAVQQKSVDIAASEWQEFRDGSEPDGAVRAPAGRSKDALLPTDSVIAALASRRSSASGHETQGGLANAAIAFAPWAVHCALVKRSCLTDAHLWQVELDPFASEDTAFWFRLLMDCSVGYVAASSALYRVETLDCRNQFNDSPAWFAAMKAVTRSNLQFLESRNLKPNAVQCESLMRLFSSVASRAWKNGDAEVLKCAEAESQRWLEECAALGGIQSLPLRIRNWLSIRIFNHLQRLVMRHG